MAPGTPNAVSDDEPSDTVVKRDQDQEGSDDADDLITYDPVPSEDDASKSSFVDDPIKHEPDGDSGNTLDTDDLIAYEPELTEEEANAIAIVVPKEEVAEVEEPQPQPIENPRPQFSHNRLPLLNGRPLKLPACGYLGPKIGYFGPPSQIFRLMIARVQQMLGPEATPSRMASVLPHLRRQLLLKVIQQQAPGAAAKRFRCRFCPTVGYATVTELLKHHAIVHDPAHHVGGTAQRESTEAPVQNKPSNHDPLNRYICVVCRVKHFATIEETQQHMRDDHGYGGGDDDGEDEDDEDDDVEDIEPNQLSDESGVSEADFEAADESLSEYEEGVEEASVSASSDEGWNSASTSSSGMHSGMDSDTSYVSSPPSPSRSDSCPSSSDEDKHRKVVQKLPIARRALPSNTGPAPAVASSNGQCTIDEALIVYLRTLTLKSLDAKIASEHRYRCSCKGCPFRFITGSVRDQHVRCHVNDGSIGSRCAVENASKRRRFNFRCFRCNRKFDTWKPCAGHMWQEHQIDIGMLPCVVCKKRFIYVSHLFLHLQTHRPKHMREIECRICGQLFANQVQRAVHEALHRKAAQLAAAKQQQPQEKEQQQAQADKKRLQKQPAEQAAAETETKCDANNCDDDSDSSIENQQPQASGSRDGPVRWYSEQRCPTCKHLFSNSKILSKHIKTVHHKIKPFICNVCGYKAARKYTLTIHMRQHSGEKPLSCQLCSFRTADPSALYHHGLRHTDEKSYKCQICGFVAIQAFALKTHIQTQHPLDYERIKCKLCSFASVNSEILKRHRADHAAGLLKTPDEEEENGDDSRDGADGGPNGEATAVKKSDPKNAPECSSDCFLPPESVDSVVHDSGGITIPAPVNGVPPEHTEDTQFPN
ncbi:zinc finger protein 652 [Anopheles aquasalis]|uniref:zinc finger protein 652 n=1 Tax=Anopheles aquasalis TaxID=42839 RepID=UPI00215AFD7B|nr:zinc finger protein 652 [Anopheles aquasalis]